MKTIFDRGGLELEPFHEGELVIIQRANSYRYDYHGKLAQIKSIHEGSHTVRLINFYTGEDIIEMVVSSRNIRKLTPDETTAAIDVSPKACGHFFTTNLILKKQKPEDGVFRIAGFQRDTGFAVLLNEFTRARQTPPLRAIDIRHATIDEKNEHTTAVLQKIKRESQKYREALIERVKQDPSCGLSRHLQLIPTSL